MLTSSVSSRRGAGVCPSLGIIMKKSVSDSDTVLVTTNQDVAATVEEQRNNANTTDNSIAAESDIVHSHASTTRRISDVTQMTGLQESPRKSPPVTEHSLSVRLSVQKIFMLFTKM